MYYKNGAAINPNEVAGAFAKRFSDKVKLNSNKTRVDLNGVYNGKRKLLAQNRNFMTKDDVKMCLSDLKSKRCEGFDRIPQCILLDARNSLLVPFFNVFNQIYLTCKIPEQWKVAKVAKVAKKNPIFIKGKRTEIENYRPVANLCSASKVFEKLILKQIHYLESKNSLDLTGKEQHGFKKSKSTATAGALLQSLIGRAADNNCYVVMASLDLSCAFDLVNIELLIRAIMQ